MNLAGIVVTEQGTLITTQVHPPIHMIDTTPNPSGNAVLYVQGTLVVTCGMVLPLFSKIFSVVTHIPPVLWAS